MTLSAKVNTSVKAANHARNAVKKKEANQNACSSKNDSILTHDLNVQGMTMFWQSSSTESLYKDV